MPMVMRAPSGGGIRALEQHSESREAIYAHTPGLKVVMPSGPRNARALLHAAICDPDPVIYYEPKALYRLFKEEVPDSLEVAELGKAKVVKAGKDITLISYGASMRETLEAAQILAEKDNVDVEVIDLLSLVPLDTETIVNSVCKTGRAIVVHEGPRTCGLGAEVVSRINEHVLLYLEAPVRRVTGFDLPIPFFSKEKAYLPDAERIVMAARETLSF